MLWLQSRFEGRSRESRQTSSTQHLLMSGSVLQTLSDPSMHTIFIRKDTQSQNDKVGIRPKEVPRSMLSLQTTEHAVSQRIPTCSSGKIGSRAARYLSGEGTEVPDPRRLPGGLIHKARAFDHRVVRRSCSCVAILTPILGPLSQKEVA